MLWFAILASCLLGLNPIEPGLIVVSVLVTFLNASHGPTLGHPRLTVDGWLPLLRLRLSPLWLLPPRSVCLRLTESWLGLVLRRGGRLSPDIGVIRLLRVVWRRKLAFVPSLDVAEVLRSELVVNFVAEVVVGV